MFARNILKNRNFSRRAALLFLCAPLVLAPSVASANRNPCPSPKAFVNDIYNCGANEVAVRIGQQCSDHMMAEAKVQGAALQAALELMKPALGDGQNLSMSDTAKRLKIAIDQFSRQIVRMQKQTKQVASYTEAMIDFADGEDDDTSAECFSRNFHKLEDVVNGMTDEILKSKAAREAALQMLATVNQRDTNLDASLDGFNGKLPGSPAAASGRVPAASAPMRKGKEYRPSDVTGTEDLNKKRKK